MNRLLRHRFLILITVGLLSVTVRAEDLPAHITMPSTLRVRILHVSHSFTIGCTGNFTYTTQPGGKAQSSSKSLTVTPKGHKFVLGSKGYQTTVLIAPVQSNDYLTVNRRRYRGVLLIEPAGHGRVDVVEQVPVEEYLYGVLPREVGGDWPAEALKSQAVVSRTYVLANMATDPAQRYDLTNDVYSQVYGGLEDEVSAASQAVDATRGDILLTKAGKPLEAFFHSSCGCRTEVPQYVWKTHEATDDFSSISDSYCKEDPYNHWQAELSVSTIRARLRRSGVRLGDISKIKILKKSPSERAWVLGIYTSSGTREISGQNFRMALGPEVLRSTLITDISRTKHGFRFEGRGWGHGVGLCQWGARGRAKAGQSYQEILKAYYPNETLVHV
jgi:stage II sporulation protein D